MALNYAIIKDMDAEERAAFFKRMDVSLDRAGKIVIANFRRAKVDIQCSLDELLTWSRRRSSCILAVKHPHPSTAAIKVSAFGDAAQAVFLPRSQIIVRPQSTDEFLLAIVPQWLRQKTPQLQGELAESAGPMSVDRETWARLVAIRDRINHEIWIGPRRLKKEFQPRKQFLLLNRNDVA